MHSEERDLLKRDHGQCRGQGSTEVASQAGTSLSGAAAHMDISKDHKVVPKLTVQFFSCDLRNRTWISVLVHPHG